MCWPCVNILGLNYWSGWENTETTAFKAWESCYDTGYNHCPDFGTFAGFFLSESRSMKKTWIWIMNPISFGKFNMINKR